MDVLTEADVVVVGAGAAGLAAAVEAARQAPKARTLLVSAGPPGHSGCSPMVQGMNAAVSVADSPHAHFEDIVRRGCFLNDQRLAWTVAHEAPGVVAELGEVLGCEFARQADGSYDQLAFGMQTHPRKLHKGYDTGREILDGLLRAARERGVSMLTPARGVDVAFDDDGRVAGLVVLDPGQRVVHLVTAPAVVVATGGAPNVFERTSAGRGKTGDGIALCARAGAECRDMEMVQYLSVGLLDPALEAGEPLPLLEESLRFAGGRLVNGDGDRFLTGIAPEAMEGTDLETVVRACWTEVAEGRGSPAGGVYLDLRHLEAAGLARGFTIPMERVHRAGWDPAVDLLEISPVAHYQVGGVLVDDEGRTTVSGLFAAGEDAGGVHGAAWTGGNGIAEALVLGARAGLAAADLASTRRPGAARSERPETNRWVVDDPLALLRGLRRMMWEMAGPVRTERGLREARLHLGNLGARIPPPETPIAEPTSSESLDLRNLFLNSLLLVESALARPDSLGVHWRADSVPSDPVEGLEHSIVRLAQGEVASQMRPVRFEILEPTPSPS